MKTIFTLPCGCAIPTSEDSPSGDLSCQHGTRLHCWAPNHFDARSHGRMEQLQGMGGSEIYAESERRYCANGASAAPSWVPATNMTPIEFLRQEMTRLGCKPQSYLDIGSGTVGPSDYWYFNDLPMEHRITSDAFELRDDGNADPKKWVFLYAFGEDLSELLSQHRFDLIIIPETLEHIPMELHVEILHSAESLLSRDGLLYISSCNEVPHFHDEAKSACAVNPVGPFRNMPSCDLLRDRGYEVFWNKDYQVLAHKRGRDA